MTGVHAFHVCVQKVLTKTAGILAAQRSSSTALPRPHAFSLAFHGEGYRIEGRITAPSTKGVCTLTLPKPQLVRQAAMLCVRKAGPAVCKTELPRRAWNWRRLISSAKSG